MGASGGEYVVDQLGGAGGSAEAESLEAFLPWFAGMCGAEDQLLADLVYGAGPDQHGGVGDAEVMQDALDRARASLRVVGLRLGRLLLAVRHGLAIASGRGAGEGEDVAWRADLGGDCGDSGGGVCACGSCVVVGVEQDVDAVARCWREGVGDVEAVGEAAGGDEQPPGLSGVADLAVADGRDLREGLGGLVDGRDHGGEAVRSGSKGFRRARRVGRAEGRGPGGVGVGEPSGPQGQVGGLGGVGCDRAAGVGGNPIPRPGGVQPGRPGHSRGIGASEQVVRKAAGAVLEGAGGQDAEQELAVVADYGAAGGGVAERVGGQGR